MAKSKGLRKGSKKRGGFFGLGNIINTAVVPGSLLALQQTYRKRKNGHKLSWLCSRPTYFFLNYLL